MIDEGVLDAAGSRAIAAFGVHVNTSERGIVSTKPGTLQAGSSVLQVTVHGRGGHGSQPTQAVDPVPALAQEAQAEEAVRRHVDAVALRRAQGADEVLRIRIVLDQ